MMNLNWDVTIRKAENGIMVAVGCKRFVFGKAEFGTFLSDLEGYLNDDISIGKKYVPEMFEERNKVETGTYAERVYLMDTPPPCPPEQFL